MKLKVQLVVCADDGREEPVQEVATFDKDRQRIEHLGLTLAEAKQLLATLQQHLVTRQASTFVAARDPVRSVRGNAPAQRAAYAHLPHSLWHGQRCPVHACIIVAVGATQPPHFARSLPCSRSRQRLSCSSWRRNGPR